VAGAVWIALFLALYLKIAHRDGNGIAWWYVVLVAATVALNLAAAVDGATQRAGKALLVSLVLLVLAGLLAVATIGLLLVPALVATAIAIGAINRRPAIT
jgi:hypothetical protein